VADIIAMAPASAVASSHWDGLLAMPRGVNDDLTVYVDFVQGAHDAISPMVAASLIGPSAAVALQRQPHSRARSQPMPSLTPLASNNAASEFSARLVGDGEEEEGDEQPILLRKSTELMRDDDGDGDGGDDDDDMAKDKVTATHKQQKQFATLLNDATAMIDNNSIVNQSPPTSPTSPSSPTPDLPLILSEQPVHLSAQFVDKRGDRFRAYVQVQRRRVGVVELFRGSIEPVDGGEMTVVIVAGKKFVCVWS
jgi:hypothetical protein